MLEQWLWLRQHTGVVGHALHTSAFAAARPATFTTTVSPAALAAALAPTSVTTTLAAAVAAAS